MFLLIPGTVALTLRLFAQLAPVYPVSLALASPGAAYCDSQRRRTATAFWPPMPLLIVIAARMSAG